MIYTITLNPAIDHAIISSNQVSISKKEAAGKGINVSRVLQKLGVQNVACTILGGENGQFIQTQLKQEGIPLIYQSIQGNTRENIKVISANGPVEEHNNPGPDYPVKLVHLLLDDVFSQARIGDIVVLSGSIPQKLPVNIYHDIILECHTRGLLVCLDASGPVLASGIPAKPDIMTPNKEELEQLAGRKLPTIKSIVHYGKTLLEKGIKEVIITLGKDGLLYISDDSIIQVPAITVPVINTVGAGDSFVAGFVMMRDQKRPVSDCLMFASAVATASVTEQTTVLSNLSKIKTYQEQITLKYLSI